MPSGEFPMNAEITNALTNALHAVFLLIYFLAACRANGKETGSFSRLVVGFFFLTFLLKVMGVFVHYRPDTQAAGVVWVVVGVGVVLLHYLIMAAVGFPARLRMAGLLFCAVTGVLALALRGFDFVSIQILGINLAAALWCGGLLRIGFLGVALSNAFWLAARRGTEAWIGGPLPTTDRYDNDFYHVLLIASTFIIYRAFSRGEQGAHPGRGV